MTTATVETLADLIERLGSIPLQRVRYHPYPGTATEADVPSRSGGAKRLCELVDGVLVEKPMGYYESRVAAVLIYFLERYLESSDLGIVLGADATLRLMAGLVRLPDVSFVCWERLPGRELPREPVPHLVPDLAVEILSEGNTEAEMARKVREYFAAGTLLVWLVDPETRSVRVHTAPEAFHRVLEPHSLDGASVLPGFTLPIADWFARVGKKA